MRKFFKIASLYLLIVNSLYSINLENMEEIYLQIRSEKLSDDFYMLKYDTLNDKIYIGLNSLFYFLELYSLEVDLVEKRVIGKLGKKNIRVKFDKDKYFIENGEIFVESSEIIKKLDFKFINFDLSTLNLEVKANFLLPYEEKEKSKVERLRLDGNKEEKNKNYDISMVNSFIQPGLLKLNYSKDDIEEKEYSLNYEYGTQFLWGELYLGGSIKPEGELGTGTLTYHNIIEENDLKIGSVDLIAPSFISVDTNLIGGSFDAYDTYSQTKNGEVIIRGEAENADSIEVYRNNILVDYLLPKEKKFEFRIADGVLSSEYLLKIYYKDGRIEERIVYSLGDMDALKKGKSKFLVQGGKTESKGIPQRALKGYYGLTDNLTVGGGFYSLESMGDKKFEILEGDLIYNTRVERFPTLINFSNFYEAKEKERSYTLKIDQRVYDYDFRLLRESYSKYIYLDNGLKTGDTISLSKSFEYNFIELGASERVFLEDEVSLKNRSLYVGISNSYFSPIFLSLRVNKDIDGDNKGVTYYPSISYPGFVSIILDGEIRRDEILDYETYTLKINKRQIEIVEDVLYGDIEFQGKYSTKDDSFIYGINFSLDLESFLNLRSNASIDVDADKKKIRRTGLEGRKVIDLSDPLRRVDNEMTVNNYLIKGHVFLDRNGNGVFDEGDKPLENVGVIVENKRFYSNEKGEYVATGSGADNIIDVDIDRKTIDPMMKNSKGKLRVQTKSSANLKLDIPIEVVSMITGNIWNSETYSDREFIRNISMTSIQLKKDGKVYKEIDPEFDGLFFFEDIPPGKYEMKFIYYGQENVSFSPKSIDIDVKLQNPEEGEYFDGKDTVMITEVVQEPKNVEQIVDENSEEDIFDIDDVINNY